MKKLLLLFILVSGVCFGQNIPPIAPPEFDQNQQFQFLNNTLNKYVVHSFSNKPKNILYSKTIEWIKRTYKNASAVIIATVDNDFIKFKGATDYIIYRNSIYPNAKAIYTMTIDFKDNKYKMEVENVVVVDENFLRFELDFPLKEKDGSGSMEFNISGLKDEFNSIDKSLQDYITSGNKDW